jgi:hypothetical protein
MRHTHRESLGRVLAAVRRIPRLKNDVESLLPLLEPPRRKRTGIVPREDQTHIPL